MEAATSRILVVAGAAALKLMKKPSFLLCLWLMGLE